jgi:hypothetical protein
MSRPTDTERGARMALDICEGHRQRPLFGMTPEEFALDGTFASIFFAAQQQVAECVALREAQRA